MFFVELGDHSLDDLPNPFARKRLYLVCRALLELHGYATRSQLEQQVAILHLQWTPRVRLWPLYL
jgi:hypothetical protein